MVEIISDSEAVQKAIENIFIEDITLKETARLTPRELALTQLYIDWQVYIPDGEEVVIAHLRGQGIIDRFMLAAQHPDVYLNLVVDGIRHYTPVKELTAKYPPQPSTVNSSGGETNEWRLLDYNTTDNYYAIMLNYRIYFLNTLYFVVLNASGADKYVNLQGLIHHLNAEEVSKQYTRRGITTA